MDFSSLRFDTTINVESLIAAIGVVGAAIGYLVSLMKNWRYNYKDKRYRGTNSIILDLLENNFAEGLSEDELWNLYCSQETSEKRKVYGTWKPNKLKRLGFEGQLRHLQGKFLIRLTGINHYHIDFQDAEKWKREKINKSRKELENKLFSKISNETLKKAIVQEIQKDNSYSFQRADLYIELLKLDEDQAVESLTNDLHSGDKEKIATVIETIRKIKERYY